MKIESDLARWLHAIAWAPAERVRVPLLLRPLSWLLRGVQGLPPEQPPPASRLLLVGRAKIVQARVPRQSEFWAVEGPVARNAAPVPVDAELAATRWVLLSAEGDMLFAGRFQRTVHGREVPAGFLRVALKGEV